MMPDLQLYYRTEETNSMGLSINTDMPTKRTEAPETHTQRCQIILWESLFLKSDIHVRKNAARSPSLTLHKNLFKMEQRPP